MVIPKTATESRARSLIKGLTWRLVGSVDTFIISLIRTKEHKESFYLVITEIVTKYVLYYFHERIWNYFLKGNQPSRKISFLKTVSWRTIGTLDTMTLAWIYFGDPLIGLQIAVVELVTKMVLFYVHERMWLRIKRGTMARWFPFLEKTIIYEFLLRY